MPRILNDHASFLHGHLTSTVIVLIIRGRERDTCKGAHFLDCIFSERRSFKPIRSLACQQLCRFVAPFFSGVSQYLISNTAHTLFRTIVGIRSERATR